jgi:hypothetical protein
MYFGVCASLAQTLEIIPAVNILELSFPAMWNHVVSLRLQGRFWYLRVFGAYLPNYTASYSRRPSPLYLYLLLFYVKQSEVCI